MTTSHMCTSLKLTSRTGPDGCRLSGCGPNCFPSSFSRSSLERYQNAVGIRLREVDIALAQLRRCVLTFECGGPLQGSFYRPKTSPTRHFSSDEQRPMLEKDFTSYCSTAAVQSASQPKMDDSMTIFGGVSRSMTAPAHISMDRLPDSPPPLQHPSSMQRARRWAEYTISRATFTGSSDKEEGSHYNFTCKPCAHVFSGGCHNGTCCTFCHHSDHQLLPPKKWKKLAKNNPIVLRDMLTKLAPLGHSDDRDGSRYRPLYHPTRTQTT